MLGSSLQKEVGRQGIGHAGKVADIGRVTDRKSFLDKTKIHMVSHMVCFELAIFNTRAS